MRHPDSQAAQDAAASRARRDGSKACPRGNKRSSRGTRCAAGTWCRWHAAILVFFAIAGAPVAARPTPRLTPPPQESIPLPLTLLVPADSSQPLPYNRRLLDASSVLAPEASVAAAMWRPDLEAWVQQLVAANSPQLPKTQQQAIDVLVTDARALAHEVISSTRSNLNALAAQLVASMPTDTSATAMATLLHTTDFNARLKEAVDDAVVLVTRAMDPHLPVVAQTAHAALTSCMQRPEDLDTLPIFADSFLPHFVEKFSVNVVEATLLHSLWRDA